MREIDQFIIDKIFHAFKRHISDKFPDTTFEIVRTPKDDCIKMTIIFGYNGLFHSFGVILRAEYLIQDFAYQLFKLADSEEVDSAIEEMSAQWKSMQPKPQ